MKLGTVTQQPDERLSYTINYTEALPKGDNVLSAEAKVEPAGLIVENVTPMDPHVRLWLRGGMDGVTYKVSVTTQTADGRTFQDEIMVKIKEV